MSHHLVMVPAPEPATPLGRLRVMSPHAGIRMSPLQLGSMSIGDAWSDGMNPMTKESAFALLDGFYEAGGVSIDTANNYQDEQSELWLGEWLQAREIRDEMVIATKYTSNYKGYRIGKNRAINASGNARKSMMISLEDSLRKLQVSYIDIFYLHWWDYTCSIKEIMDSLHMLVESGKVLYLGISDTPAWIVSAACQYAMDNGKTPFSIYQGKWNCMSRDFERDIIPMARDFGLALAPWGALGGGHILSKKQLEERKAAGEIIRRGVDALTDEETQMSQTLLEVGEAHGVESPTAVALAYVMSKYAYVFPIVGGRKVEHLKQNIEALTLKLTSEDIAKIEGLQPFDVGFPNNFLGGDPRINNERNVVMCQVGTVDYVLHGKSMNVA